MCDETCPMPTQDEAVSPHPGAICPPVQSSPVHQCWSQADQYESKAGQCVPRHTTVFAPNFLPHHCLYAPTAHPVQQRLPTTGSRTTRGRGGAAYNIPKTPNYYCASLDPRTGLRGRTFPPVILPFVLSQNGISTVAQPTGS